MIKILCPIFCFFSLSLFAQKQVYIIGEIINAPEKTEISVSYYNNSIEWIEVQAGKTELDKNGRFTINFCSSKSLVVKLNVASQYTELFLEPGDSI